MTYGFIEQEIDKQAAELQKLLNDETVNGKIESLKELLKLMSAVSDGSTKIADVIDARITAALGEDGAITSAIASGAGAAITAAIGEGGSIETWGDGRYEAKSA